MGFRKHLICTMTSFYASNKTTRTMLYREFYNDKRQLGIIIFSFRHLLYIKDKKKSTLIANRHKKIQLYGRERGEDQRYSLKHDSYNMRLLLKAEAIYIIVRFEMAQHNSNAITLKFYHFKLYVYMHLYSPIFIYIKAGYLFEMYLFVFKGRIYLFIYYMARNI